MKNQIPTLNNINVFQDYFMQIDELNKNSIQYQFFKAYYNSNFQLNNEIKFINKNNKVIFFYPNENNILNMHIFFNNNIKKHDLNETYEYRFNSNYNLYDNWNSDNHNYIKLPLLSNGENIINQNLKKLFHNFIQLLLTSETVDINGNIINLKNKSIDNILSELYQLNEMKYILLELLNYSIYDFNSQNENEFFIKNLKLFLTNIDKPDPNFNQLLLLVMQNIYSYWDIMPIDIMKELVIYYHSYDNDAIDIVTKSKIKLNKYDSTFIHDLGLFYFINLICLCKGVTPISLSMPAPTKEDCCSLLSNTSTPVLDFCQLEWNAVLYDTFSIDKNKYFKMCKSLYHFAQFYNLPEFYRYSFEFSSSFIYMVFNTIKNDIHNDDKDFVDLLKYIYSKDKIHTSFNKFLLANVKIIYQYFNSYEKCSLYLIDKLDYENIDNEEIITLIDTIYNIKNKNNINKNSSFYKKLSKILVLKIKELNNLTKIQQKYALQMIIFSDVLNRDFELKAFFNAEEFNFLKLVEKNLSQPFFKEDCFSRPDAISSMISMSISDPTKIGNMNIFKYLINTKSTILRNSIINVLLLLYSYDLTDQENACKKEVLELYSDTMKKLLDITFKSNKTYKSYMIHLLAFLRFSSIYGKSTRKVFKINTDYSLDICQLYFQLVSNSYLTDQEKTKLLCGVIASIQYDYEKVYPFWLPLNTIIDIISKTDNIPDEVAELYAADYMRKNL